MLTSLNVFRVYPHSFPICLSHLVWTAAVATELVIVRGSVLKCKCEVGGLSKPSVSPRACDVSALLSKGLPSLQAVGSHLSTLISWNVPQRFKSQ